MRQADPSFPYTGHGGIDKLLRAFLALAIAVTFVSVAFLAVVHLDDRYNVNHVSGTWMALAWDLTHGVLYRPFFEHGYYGLSGYMPLQFTVNAGAALITGEYLVSAKLVAYASGLSVLALSYIALRMVGCPRLTALGLIAALVATDAGLLAVTGIHGDALPLALQLGALVLLMRSTSRRSVVVAALLCTLAVLAKFTAIWALVAIVAWLAVKKRAELVVFIGTLLASTVASLVIFEIASDGRMSKNLAEIVAPGGSASQGSPVAGVSTFFELVVEHAGAIWILLPFAALALLQAAGRRSFTLPQLALLLALPITVVVLGNPGADFNHLIDVGALTVVVVGEQLASTARDEQRPTLLPALVSIALILGIAQSYRISLKPDVAHAAKVMMGREQSAYSNKPLAPLLDKRLLVLSEDPAIPILRNEKPILSDGLGLLRLSDRHANLLHNLIARLDARAFDRIVLTHPIEDDIWYRERSLGRDVQMAIERNYVLLDKLPVNLHDEYWIYQPKASSAMQP